MTRLIAAPLHRDRLGIAGGPIPGGIQHVGRIRAIREAPSSDLPTLMREKCVAMLEQIGERNG
ncbi:hypothetical protein ASE06_06220 [Sphingopyxis sp. Root214]|uniref:hypothetical protein n=1 Tax=unclassified Sphingopyxis TaxID=2614943 RepID=UPI0006F2C5EF|nr:MULTISPECIES: hypothetical protein [unclassified Sphingopyxis]KQZ76658.1 hypothetical protein ASD73_01775 [Sphingopyxis sp. Root154]KRC09455.1 hypothetical protein ASE06_06220 [Sphingopyxis sp. Root214]